jgi:hypothetical protein
MKYKDTKFYPLLKRYKLKSFLLSLDFILAVLLTILLLGVAQSYNLVYLLLNNLLPTYINISIGLIAIIVASLALIIGMSDDTFTLLLKEVKVYDKLLFLFWYISIVVGVSLIADLATQAVLKINFTTFGLNFCLLTLTTFFTLYALFSVISSVGTIMRVGLYRGEHIYNKKQKSKGT